MPIPGKDGPVDASAVVQKVAQGLSELSALAAQSQLPPKDIQAIQAVEAQFGKVAESLYGAPEAEAQEEQASGPVSMEAGMKNKAMPMMN